jgi:hypothetical protein
MENLVDFLTRANESLLDAPDDTNMDKNMVISWLKQHTDCDFNVDDNLNVRVRNFHMWLNDGESIPACIVWEKTNNFSLHIGLKQNVDKLVLSNLPPVMGGFIISCNKVKNLVIDCPHLSSIDSMEVESKTLKELTLPKGIKVKNLNVMSVPELENIENAEKVKLIELSMSTGCRFARKAIKFSGKITVNGFGPY